MTRLHCNEFFEDVLGVKLSNPRAWGGHTGDGRTVLRTWDRETCERGDGKTWRRVLRPSTRLNTAGRQRPFYGERVDHIVAITVEPGSGFMVTVTENEKPSSSRIKEFNRRELIPIGELVEDQYGDVWAECLPPITVEQFLRSKK